MNRIAFLALTALLVSPSLAHPANAVTLRVSQTSVAGAGETATVCVSLETGGERVAGTQNDLKWNEACATLSGLKSCRVSPGHGKDLRHSFPNGDGHSPLRAFVFSMQELSPMNDTELYCCDFTSEATSAGPCTVSVENARASDPTGKALAATGTAGGINTRGSAVAGGVTGGGGGGGGGGGATGGGTGGVTGGGATGGGAAGGGATGNGAAGGGGVAGLGGAPSRLPPGGVPDEQPMDTDALAQAAAEAARAEAERILDRQIPAVDEPEVIEPTEEPTEEPTLREVPPTSPAAQPTTPARAPTAKAPTVGRTPAAAPAAAEASKKEESSSWFGCQVTTGAGADGSLFLLIGVVGMLANRIRRRVKP